MSDSLWPHELQHARPPCPSSTPRLHSNSHPSSQWCHPAISSSVIPYSTCPQILPASESFPMSQLFAWGGQSTGVSALASFFPKKSQGWSPSEWTGCISYHIYNYITFVLFYFVRFLHFIDFLELSYNQWTSPVSPIFLSSVHTYTHTNIFQIIMDNLQTISYCVFHFSLIKISKVYPWVQSFSKINAD